LASRTPFRNSKRNGMGFPLASLAKVLAMPLARDGRCGGFRPDEAKLPCQLPHGCSVFCEDLSMERCLALNAAQGAKDLAAAVYGVQAEI
jgi:hypothetical protein